MMRELFRFLTCFALLLGYTVLYLDVGARYEQIDAVSSFYDGQHAPLLPKLPLSCHLNSRFPRFFFA